MMNIILGSKSGELAQRGVRRYYKDKSSEIIIMATCPMWSTNMSDALKYYMCRLKYMRIMKGPSGGPSYAPETY